MKEKLHYMIRGWGISQIHQKPWKLQNFQLWIAQHLVKNINWLTCWSNLNQLTFDQLRNSWLSCSWVTYCECTILPGEFWVYFLFQPYLLLRKISVQYTPFLKQGLSNIFTPWVVQMVAWGKIGPLQHFHTLSGDNSGMGKRLYRICNLSSTNEIME